MDCQKSLIRKDIVALPKLKFDKTQEFVHLKSNSMTIMNSSTYGSNISAENLIPMQPMAVFARKPSDLSKKMHLYNKFKLRKIETKLIIPSPSDNPVSLNVINPTNANFNVEDIKKSARIIKKFEQNKVKVNNLNFKLPFVLKSIHKSKVQLK
jgi:hypothetical protein